jgi:ParB-like nuclease family protein
MSTIHKTTNYSQFQFYKRNRRIACELMIESIKKKNMLKEHPIIVDKNMFVIDGQHRLKAAEHLKTPIYYIISENLGEEDIGICQTQKVWLIGEFLKFYEDKNDDYRFIKKIHESFKYPLHFIVYTVQNTHSSMKEFKSGEIVIKKDKKILEENYENLYDIIETVKQIVLTQGSKKMLSHYFYRACWAFINKQDYCHRRMMKSLLCYGSNILPLIHLNGDSLIIEGLKNRIYNFRKIHRPDFD